MIKKICASFIVLLLILFPVTIYGNDNETAKVYFPVGKPFYLINGIQYPMDVVTYISENSNSIMIPIKYLVEATNMISPHGGLTTEWDSDTDTTILDGVPLRDVQFTAGESTVIINGVSVPMLTADNLPAIAEIKGEAGHERMHVPLRAFGAVVGLYNVDWDAETRTAILNW